MIRSYFRSGSAPAILRLPLMMSAAVGLVLAGISPAMARDEPAGEQVSIAVSKVRAKAADLDANSDGWLTEDETARGRDKLGVLYGAIERRVDANRDGRVSVDEYVHAQVLALEAADADNDGWISRGEAKTQKRRLVMELLGG